MPSTADWPEQLVKQLSRYVTGKNVVPEYLAALAGLRRGLGKEPGEDTTPFRYIGDFLDGCSDDEVAWAYRVAALCAWHQGFWSASDRAKWKSNLGSSMALAKSAVGDSVERRFTALLNCHGEDLPTHLRHAVGILRSRETPILVDWEQLLHDVLDWDNDDREVQRRWARSFWPYKSGRTPTATAEQKPRQNNSETSE